MKQANIIRNIYYEIFMKFMRYLKNYEIFRKMKYLLLGILEKFWKYFRTPRYFLCTLFAVSQSQKTPRDNMIRSDAEQGRARGYDFGFYSTKTRISYCRTYIVSRNHLQFGPSIANKIGYLLRQRFA